MTELERVRAELEELTRVARDLVCAYDDRGQADAGLYDAMHELARLVRLADARPRSLRQLLQLPLPDPPDPALPDPPVEQTSRCVVCRAEEGVTYTRDRIDRINARPDVDGDGGRMALLVTLGALGLMLRSIAVGPLELCALHRAQRKGDT